MTRVLIQIKRWLLLPGVWRFVGFTSAAVGLVCYALSSSFNRLFGEWNVLKISVYSVFCFIICLLVLFAELWQYSTRHQFKAHMAFLVLAITSIYSFFYDKVVNGKPDAYSLISYAAFAVMFLSLSRLTHCGFELELLNFFLGCLIVQLMKIKLVFAIVGVSFSYSLIILRSSLDALTQTPSYPGLDDHVVIQLGSLQDRLLNDQPAHGDLDSRESYNDRSHVMMAHQVARRFGPSQIRKALRYMELSNRELESLPEQGWKCLTPLEVPRIKGLTGLPEDILHLASLKDLVIKGYPGLFKQAT